MWEEGRLSGRRVTRLSVLAVVLLAALDLALTRHLGLVFDIGFVLICVAAALAVRPRDFFRVGVLPPLLLLGLVLVLAVAHRSWVADAQDGLVQAVVTGLTRSASGLGVGYLLTLAVLGMRQRVLGRRARAGAHSKREGSPMPTRTTSGPPSEKSTTVVGSEPHSPESITAST